MTAKEVISKYKAVTSADVCRSSTLNDCHCSVGEFLSHGEHYGCGWYACSMWNQCVSCGFDSGHTTHTHLYSPSYYTEGGGSEGQK